MGSIDIIQPLSTVRRSTANISQHHKEKNRWECRESNPGLLGEKQVCYLFAMLPPHSNWLVLIHLFDPSLSLNLISLLIVDWLELPPLISDLEMNHRKYFKLKLSIGL